MIKKLIPTLVFAGSTFLLMWLIRKYLPIMEVRSQANDLTLLEDSTADPEETYQEKRRTGHEDRRKSLRDLAMSRPRRKDELIH